MIKGIGIDIIEIDRLKEAVKKYGHAFLSRVFTDSEIKYCRAHKIIRFPELAVRFAAKEAYSKAIGTGIRHFGKKNDGLAWKDVEVGNEPNGRPYLSVKGRRLKKAYLSLSHSRDYAVAAVYVEK